MFHQYGFGEISLPVNTGTILGFVSSPPGLFVDIDRFPCQHRFGIVWKIKHGLTNSQVNKGKSYYNLQRYADCR
jgi:hypothetical protein